MDIPFCSDGTDGKDGTCSFFILLFIPYEPCNIGKKLKFNAPTDFSYFRQTDEMVDVEYLQPRWIPP